MSIRRTALVVAWFLVAGCGGCGGDSAPPRADLPDLAAGKNLLIVLLDAAAAGHFGCYGYDRDTTPNIDRLAVESVLFEDVWPQASGTMLSVFSFFTSRYPLFGEDLRVNRNMTLTLPDDLPTLPEILAPRFTGRLGAVNNTWLKGTLGYRRGFTGYRAMNDRSRSSRERDGDAVLVESAQRWLARFADGQLMAYLHLIRPHGPYDPPEPWPSRFADPPPHPEYGTHDFFKRFEGRSPGPEDTARVVDLYDANLAYADHLVGELIAGLEEAGKWDDTIFVLMSDHGQAHWEHDAFGHGGMVWEEMLRVPLLIRVPGLPARRVTEPVQLVDLLPTLMELFGIERPDLELAGRSLCGAMVGGPDDEAGGRFLFSRTNRRDPPIYTIRRGDLKLMLGPEEDRRRLFDLAADPAEMQDLAGDGAHADRSRVLEGQLRLWIRSGGLSGSTVTGLPLDSLDPADLEHLRALGYVD